MTEQLTELVHRQGINLRYLVWSPLRACVFLLAVLCVRLLFIYV
jgi:hypothetical protein